MLVYVKLGSVRWIQGESVARKPRRKRQRWLFAGAASDQGPPRITAVRLSVIPQAESVKNSRRLPRLRRIEFLFLPE